MSDTVLRDEIARIVRETRHEAEGFSPESWRVADRILAIPELRVALGVWERRKAQLEAIDESIAPSTRHPAR